ncbi:MULTISPECIES: CDP-glycerol glycerophosphotransferase family protein [Lactiplantibacillus]|uniref:CDP-glycerol glycerophosphotransferase family protein n=1 Tax=Lactiplantibacillus TaxID=2767842 RepID=UPI0007E3DA19|nr:MULTISPECIES: CDP-glycerol glycerophosphotransferase family protein [Lactiplantibacillus]ANJ15420.1 glycosyl transferase [Lactiplantibacillus plantarum]AUH38761.1 CDP-glycerol glycerophosphotransferase family protein [Lactiplantibacillus plantarum]MBP5818536.1 CDP-glycerol glycerophosphotransferase family protein [Lactiplantibacillus plantarum]MBU7482195.1 CDP-glycerol glycerophosphotransferase family protein [Lactiplantibacillus pentosus]QSE56913.1 CDP-glycerol glycerophosphotransferase fa
MRAILSGIHAKQDKQVLELELIDVPFAVENLALIFMEKNALASRSIPIRHTIHNNMLKLTIAPQQFIFDDATQSEFSWEMYFAFNSENRQYLLQVESEFVSDRHQLTLDSYFQFNADDQEHALFDLHTHQSADEFAINSVNLTPDGLNVTGYSVINGAKLSDQRLILKNQQTGNVRQYSDLSNLLRGLFSITLPLNDLKIGEEYTLLIEYTFGDQSVSQRVILTRPLEGQQTLQPQANGQLIQIEKTYNNGIMVRALPARTLAAKIGGVGQKAGQVKDVIHQLNQRVNTRYMKRLFKMGHRQFDATTIIFESFGGRQVSDSPLAIYELFKKLYPGFRYIWSVEREAVPYCKANGIPYVVRRTARWARTLEKAQYWISNARFPAWVRKPKYVTYIQTWHGTPLKKLGLDIENVAMPGTNTAAYHRNFVSEANRWDALVSPNDYSTQIFRSAFGFKNQILKVGYPRNDELINSSPEDVTALKQQLGIPLDKKVVLYAPTYRDNQFAEKGKYTFELPFSLADFRERFGQDAVLILRMHYLISNALDVSDYSDFVYDLSSYPNISDLYLVSDLLITDYSSVFFDYAYLQRPILFYPYDYHLYKDELRGFYLDYEKDLPGKIAQNEADLLDNVEEFLQRPDMSQDPQFQKFYGRFCAINDGLASFKVVNYVVHQIEARN